MLRTLCRPHRRRGAWSPDAGGAVPDSSGSASSSARPASAPASPSRTASSRGSRTASWPSGLVPDGVDFGAADGQPRAGSSSWSSRPAARRPSTCRSLAAISRWVKDGPSRRTRLLALRDPAAVYDLPPRARATLMRRTDPTPGTAPCRVARAAGRGARPTSTSACSRASRTSTTAITHPRVQKPGLAFAGYYAYIKPGRVQIIGESETEYLRTLGEEERARAAGRASPACRCRCSSSPRGSSRCRASSPSARAARCPCSPRRPCPRPSSRGSATSWRTTWSPRPRCTACCWRSTAWACC